MTEDRKSALRSLVERVAPLRWLHRLLYSPVKKRLVRFRKASRIARVRYLSRSGRRTGISGAHRTPPIVVTLTSWEPRLPGLHLCIESILRQSFRPDRLILWLAHDTGVPAGLEQQSDRGLEIRFCPDIRSYKKIIYAIREAPDSVLVTADDDVIYHGSWLRELVNGYRSMPEAVHCQIGHRMRFDPHGSLLPYASWDRYGIGFQGPSYLLFPTGVGGVLYPPGAFHEDVTREDLFMRLAPNADDVWLKAMTLLRERPVAKVRKELMPVLPVPGSQKQALFRRNVGEGLNDAHIRAVFEHYGLERKLWELTGGAEPRPTST